MINLINDNITIKRNMLFHYVCQEKQKQLVIYLAHLGFNELLITTKIDVYLGWW